jgi:hypothetical protein
MSRRSERARYQVICYEIIGEQRNLIMDSTDHGFIAPPARSNAASSTANSPTPDHANCKDTSP